MKGLLDWTNPEKVLPIFKPNFDFALFCYSRPVLRYKNSSLIQPDTLSMFASYSCSGWLSSIGFLAPNIPFTAPLILLLKVQVIIYQLVLICSSGELL